MFAKLLSTVAGRISLPIGFFLVLFGLLLVIVIPNLDQISERFGFVTKNSLQKQVIEQKSAIDELGTANKDLSLKIDQQKETNENAATAITNITDHQTEVIKITAENKNKIKNPVIKNKQTTVTKTEVIQVAVLDEIAENQINVIWEQFCKLNPDSETCVRSN